MFDTLSIAAVLPVASSAGTTDSPSDSGFAELMAAEVEGGRTDGTKNAASAPDTGAAHIAVLGGGIAPKDPALHVQTPLAGGSSTAVQSVLAEGSQANDGTVMAAPGVIEQPETVKQAIAPSPAENPAIADPAAGPASESTEVAAAQPVPTFAVPAFIQPAPPSPAQNPPPGSDTTSMNAEAPIINDGAALTPPANTVASPRDTSETSGIAADSSDRMTERTIAAGGGANPSDLPTPVDLKSIGGARDLANAQVKEIAAPVLTTAKPVVEKAAETVATPPPPSVEKATGEKAIDEKAPGLLAQTLGAAGVSRIEARAVARTNGSAARIDDARAIEGGAEGDADGQASVKTSLVQAQASAVSDVGPASDALTSSLPATPPLAGAPDMARAADMETVDDGLFLAVPFSWSGFGAATASMSMLNSGLTASISTATADTVAALGAQIARRLESRSTRFEIGLTPDGMGQVDVTLDIDADGGLTARLAFDNPLSAAELRGRVDELRRQLQEAGFTVGQDALSFTERDAGQSGGRDGRSAREFLAESARAFAGAGRLNDAAETALTTPVWASRSQTPTGVDVKV